MTIYSLDVLLFLVGTSLLFHPCSPRDSQESSPAPQFKSINSSALQHGPRGQSAGPGTPGALRSGVVPAALAAPAALRLLRAGVRPDDHRPPGQVSREPLRAIRLRAEPEPAGAGARIGQLSVPSLRLYHPPRWPSLSGELRREEEGLTTAEHFRVSLESSYYFLP